MNKVIKNLTCVSAASLFCFPTVVLGAQGVKLPPRLFAWGNAGNRFFGEGDAMIPFGGNRNQSFFFDITGKYGNDDASLLSAGVGNRTIIRDKAILGAYLFNDYNKTSHSNNFNVINPGIEAMTNEWDAHLNGYFPVGKRSKTMVDYTGSQAGISNSVFFAGHSQYDRLFDLVEDVGTGTDLEVGRTIFSLNRARVFAGGYYFSPKYSSTIKGVGGGIEMPLKYRGMQVGVRDTYDNINHNTIALTLRLAFGGLEQTQTPDIHERMLDLIPRHLGSLRSGDGIPSEVSAINKGRTILIQDNIWFFNADGAPSLVEGFQSCTFENPCIGLAQTQIDTINTLSPNANFYFSPGTYNNPAVGTGFSFYNGQNISGRTSNFMQLASGSNRPLLNDSLSLNGNNTVNNIRVFGNSILNVDTGGMLQPFTTGVLVTTTATGVVNINNTDIVSEGTITNAIAAVNNSPTATLNINNSTLASSILNIPGAITIGAANVSSGTLNINGTSITVTESDLVNNFDIAFGVVNNENGVINIADSSIAVSSTNAGLTAGVLNNSTVGIGVVNIARTTITVLADNSNLAAAVFNQANNVGGIGGIVNIDQSSLSMTSNNNLGGLAAAVFNTADSTVNITNSDLTGNGNDGIIAGIFNGDPLSTVNIQNNTIAVNLSGTAIGAPIINGGTLNDNGGNQCFQDGMPVAC
ncbi:MAG: inverse autotransporter beta domain-containing protein [Legionella sp.]|nr:inverse autotransporter beta domain-containing protein [Legionella sp.]